MPSPRMEILILNQYFYPDSSATAQLLTELCEDLAEHHDVHVVTGRPSYNPTLRTGSRGLISHESLGQVRISRVWSTTFDRSWMLGRLINYASYLASSLAGALCAGHPDVVIALTDPPPVGLIGALVARLRGVPFILVAQDIFPDVAVRLGRLTNPHAIAALRLVSRRIFWSAQCLVSIGRDMNRRLIELGISSERIVTIQGWADTNAIRPLDGPSRLRREWGLDHRFVVMHSGNVGLSQNLQTVLEAARLLLKQRDIVFAIVGQGASRARLEHEANSRGLDNVVFLPLQPKALLSDSLGAADVHLVAMARGLDGYIVPSKVYGILAAGKPFIAAVEAGSEPALIIAEQECGLQVEPENPRALAEAVLAMRCAPLDEMGRRARRAAENLYDRRRASNAYLELLGTVGSASPRYPGPSG